MTKEEINEKLYWFKIESLDFIYDGDTATAFVIDFGFGRYEKVKRGQGRRLRLKGINSPELKTKAGKEARNFMKQFQGKEAFVKSYKYETGKYGGYVFDLYCEYKGKYVLLNKLLVDLGHAIEVKY